MSGTELSNLNLLAGNSSFNLSNKKSYFGLSLIEFSDKSNNLEENLLRSFYRDLHPGSPLKSLEKPEQPISTYVWRGLKNGHFAKITF